MTTDKHGIVLVSLFGRPKEFSNVAKIEENQHEHAQNNKNTITQ
jgi:hypothetical protein